MKSTDLWLIGWFVLMTMINVEVIALHKVGVNCELSFILT